MQSLVRAPPQRSSFTISAVLNISEHAVLSQGFFQVLGYMNARKMCSFDQSIIFTVSSGCSAGVRGCPKDSIILRLNVVMKPRIRGVSYAVLSQGKGAGLADFEKLPYIRAVLAESLRMFPQPPILIRRALADDTLPSGLNGDPKGYPVGKGADIFISVWNLHRCGPAGLLPFCHSAILPFHGFPPRVPL